MIFIEFLFYRYEKYKICDNSGDNTNNRVLFSAGIDFIFITNYDINWFVVLIYFLMINIKQKYSTK